ncbi:hypothetical protein E2562_028549 [Oryza meyeriana var. granulata]|uniref:Uncharacterized protein n=1 Tax=Oryza meyeriana var. granulata TaxID=110450 RepID=A0A6G1EQQ7_9ORYZ|nr:hypothetical protein E2562_028549 [Oryza meyeriana var. granulata]
MHGYSNLACSSPPMAGSNGAARARRSLELTNTKETNAWEGLAIGAVTLARTFSTGSHKISSSSRSGGERVVARTTGGLPGALRRAFSMRRHPAGHGKGDGYYWRIHDMDGDSDGDDAAAAVGEERDGDDEKKNKKEQLDEAVDEKEEAAAKTATAMATTTPKKKRGGKIMKACKKLLRL